MRAEIYEFGLGAFYDAKTEEEFDEKRGQYIGHKSTCKGKTNDVGQIGCAL
jgi:hypothetical protein